MLFVVLGNLAAFFAQPGRDLKATFQLAMGSSAMVMALGVAGLIQVWGLVALFALKARWPEWAFLWGVVWWLGVMDVVHQVRLLQSWRQGELAAGGHLNGWPYKAWSVFSQVATLAAAVGLLWPES